jgi:phosphonate transport system substrate-binding protein
MGKMVCAIAVSSTQLKPASMLKTVSYLAPNWFAYYQAVTDALARSLSVEIQLQQGVCDPLVDPLLLQDQLDLAFICGLPAMRYHHAHPQQLQVLATPVLTGDRYHDRPIYFSDVIVKATRSAQHFSDLAGQVFCYNDRGSNSGYNLVRWTVLQHGLDQNFWDTQIESGSHQRSLEWVISGQADWAAIDSTVLDQAWRDHPEWCSLIKVVTALGPSPMPPIVVATHLGTTHIQSLQHALLQPDHLLQSAMAIAGVQRYVLQTWQDYGILAEQYRLVEG